VNIYHRAMSHCEPPKELEERLAQRVMDSTPAERRPAIRPWSLVRRVGLAAVLTIVLLAVGAGAATLVNWDGIFEKEFGRESAASPVAQTVFQKVDVTAVCGDVTLTVREALSDAQTIYLILDYRLPETVDRQWIAEAWEQQGGTARGISVNYYTTGEWDWESLKAAEQERWLETDWTDWDQERAYLRSSPLKEHIFMRGGTTMVSPEAYDVETGTITYLLMCSSDGGDQNLQDQPLTLLVLPPAHEKDGVLMPLADHPALITFQPEHTAKARSGAVETEEVAASARVSPFWLNVTYTGRDYAELEDLAADVVLELTGGRRVAARELNHSFSGGYGPRGDTGIIHYSFDCEFEEIFDAGSVKSVWIGDLEIPLTDEE